MLVCMCLAEVTLQAAYEPSETVAEVGTGCRKRPQMGRRWRCRPGPWPAPSGILPLLGWAASSPCFGSPWGQCDRIQWLGLDGRVATRCRGRRHRPSGWVLGACPGHVPHGVTQRGPFRQFNPVTCITVGPFLLKGLLLSCAHWCLRENILGRVWTTLFPVKGNRDVQSRPPCPWLRERYLSPDTPQFICWSPNPYATIRGARTFKGVMKVK